MNYVPIVSNADAEINIVFLNLKQFSLLLRLFSSKSLKTSILLICHKKLQDIYLFLMTVSRQ